MPLQTLTDVFHEQIKDMYSAEQQVAEALPKMVKAAKDKDLKQAFKDHLKETETHIERLEQVKEKLGVKGKKTCKAMKGLVKEGEEVIEEEGSAAAKDAALIIAAQKIEHYEIATYGTLCTYAEMLGYDEALELLRQSLSEDAGADEKLSQIAKTTVNKEAVG